MQILYIETFFVRGLCDDAVEEENVVIDMRYEKVFCILLA